MPSKHQEINRCYVIEQELKDEVEDIHKVQVSYPLGCMKKDVDLSVITVFIVD